jgi:hypothetical protein
MMDVMINLDSKGDLDMVEENCDLCGNFGPVSSRPLVTYFGEGEVPVVFICPKCAGEVIAEFADSGSSESTNKYINEEREYDNDIAEEARRDFNNG